MRIRNHGNYGHGLRDGENWDMNCATCKADRAAAKPPNITEDGFGPGVERKIYAKSITEPEFRAFVDAVDAASVEGIITLVRNSVGAPIAAVVPLTALPSGEQAKLPVYYHTEARRAYPLVGAASAADEEYRKWHPEVEDYGSGRLGRS